MKSVALCKVSELGSPEWIQGIQSIEEKEGVYYIAVHYGDWTMGSESLFEVKDGKVNSLINAKAFSSILIEDEAIYYSQMSMFNDKDNFSKYNKMTGETTTVGSKDFVYDMGVEESEGGPSSYWICKSAFIKEGKLYTLGYEVESYSGARLYQIYYLDAYTHELKVTDLEGNLLN